MSPQDSSTGAGTGRFSGRAEYRNDPLLLDNAGDPGRGSGIGDPGEPFIVSIDCTGADSPSIYVLSLSTGNQSAAITPWVWLYLDGRRLLGKSGRHVQSVETWFPEPTGLPLPDDPSLVGTTYTIQGLGGGFGGALRLSGAITQTIGG